jgi:hypothetical protein
MVTIPTRKKIQFHEDDNGFYVTVKCSNCYELLMKHDYDVMPINSRAERQKISRIVTELFVSHIREKHRVMME